MPATHRRTGVTRSGLASLVAAVVVAGAVTWWATATPGTAQASDPSYRTLASASNPDWMRSIPDGVSIAAISIPGTHETMSIHGGSLTMTQEDYGDSGRTLTAQLNAGIRMVDIRVRVNDGNTFTVHHGAVYQQANFDDVLNALGSFLDQHPRETVVMRLKQECTGQFGSCRDVGGQASVSDILDRYRDDNAAARAHFWAPSVNRGQAADTPTLGAVRGKVVLAVLNGQFGGRIDSYGLAQFADWRDGSSTYIQDDYNVSNPGAIATKRDRVRRHLDATSSGDQTRMYVNFTSGASLFASPYTVAGGTAGQQGVNPFLLGYLSQHPVTRTGMVMMDFPGGGLINAIIAVNRR
jgi:1-phosphatidylinositol phosphodiesterase